MMCTSMLYLEFFKTIFLKMHILQTPHFVMDPTCFTSVLKAKYIREYHQLLTHLLPLKDFSMVSNLHASFHTATVNEALDCTTDIGGRSQNLHYIYPSMGFKLGYLGFCCDKNNHDLSGASLLWAEYKDQHP